ncbi:hypothetical protein D030_3433A, partial [Vibrio parahaemolyticus AQ3810]
MSSIPASLGGG